MESNSNINEEKEKKLNLIKNEIKYVQNLIDKTEETLKNINKSVFIVYSDIIGNDTEHNYICIKSNDNSNLNIEIIDEDDLKSKDFNINTLEENINKNDNLNMNLMFENNNHNSPNNYLDPILYDKNQENKENKDIININQLYSKIMKGNSFPPIELSLMSPLDQSNSFNNIDIINNDFINK